MVLTADYHTHTVYSDGKNTVAENVARADEIGLKEIAITEHGYSHWFRGIKRKETEKWLSEIEEAKKTAKVRVLRGMENNIRGVSGLCDYTEKDFENFDLYLAGIHVVIRYEHFSDRKLGWGGWMRTYFHVKPSASYIRETTAAFVNTVKKNPVDIVTHLNYLCYADALEVARCCEDYGTYLEISSKKPHLSDDELSAIVQKTNVRFLVNSDAHAVARIGDEKLAAEQIERVGVPHDRIDNIDGKLPVFRFAAYKARM